MSLSPRFWMCESELLKVDRCDSSESKAARSARRRAGSESMVPCKTMRRPAWSISCRVMTCPLFFSFFYSSLDTLIQQLLELESRNQSLCVFQCRHVDVGYFESGFSNSVQLSCVHAPPLHSARYPPNATITAIT